MFTRNQISVSTVRGTLLVFFTIFCIAGCGGAKLPSEVTTQFYTLVSKGDYEAASEHLSAEAQLMFGLMVGVTEGFGEFSDDVFADQAVRRVEILSERISGDQAEVPYIFHFTDGSKGLEDQDVLVKEDGKWKIDLG